MTTLAQPRALATEPNKWGRRDVQRAALLGIIVVTAIAGLLVSLLFPEGGDDGLFTYETVHPDRGFVWALLLLAGVNIVATVVPAVLASLVLVPARGWRWVTAGAVLAVVGSGFYAVGLGSWASVYFFAADSAALDPATAAAFIESVNDDGFRVWAPVIGGALPIAIGTVLIDVGLWRSLRVPKWLPVIAVVGAVITFLLPTDGPLGVVVELPQAFTSVAIGWYAWTLRGDQAESA